MKDKVIKANVLQAVEHLCHELRVYTGDSMTFTLTVITRTKALESPNIEPDGVPDWYKAIARYTDSVDPHDSIFEESAKVFYGPDDFGEESIVLVQPYKAEEESEEQNE